MYNTCYIHENLFCFLFFQLSKEQRSKERALTIEGQQIKILQAKQKKNLLRLQDLSYYKGKYNLIIKYRNIQTRWQGISSFGLIACHMQGSTYL